MLRRYLPLLIALAASQTVEILQADELNGNDQVRYLKGHVLLKQDSIQLSCAQAQIQVNGFFQAGGGTITYIGESGRIQATQLTYDPTTSQLHYQNQVLATFGAITLRTNDLFYDRRIETAFYRGGGSLSDTSGTIYSEQAFYHVPTGVATFSGAVRLAHQTYLAQTDTLVYATSTQIATFPKAVWVYNPPQAETLLAGEAIWERAAQRLFLSARVHYATPSKKLWADYLTYDIAQDSGQAACNLLYQHRQRADWLIADSAQWQRDTLLLKANVAGFLFGQKDTAFLAADLALIPREGPFYLINEARLCQPSLAALADTILYDTNAQHLYLQGHAWLGTNPYQLFADKVKIQLKAQRPDSLLAEGNVRVLSSADSFLAFYQQVHSQQAEAAWDSTSQTFREIRFTGSVQAIYYQAEGPHWQGAHNLTASSLYLQVDSASRPLYLRAEGQPKGRFVPIKYLLRKPLFLSAFAWKYPTQRPQWPIQQLENPSQK